MHEMIGYVKDGWIEYYCPYCDKRVRHNPLEGKFKSWGGEPYVRHFGAFGVGIDGRTEVGDADQ